MNTIAHPPTHIRETDSRCGFGVARRDAFGSVNGTDYDVAIIGAGISGSRIFHELCGQGYRVLLIDRGDFACGTSQASGMMIWGGLLYLKDFDFGTVGKLSRARDELIDQLPDKVQAAGLRYMSGVRSLRNRHLVRAGMLLYWLMGSMKRRFPRAEAGFSEHEILKAGKFRDSLAFEEAVLRGSDCRFALEWVLPFLGPWTSALNHCLVENLDFNRSDGKWRMDLRDRLHGSEATVSSRFIVNAAGVWTDQVNEKLDVESPYRHELSKGVYISIKRPVGLDQILIFDTGKNSDTLTISPWGPVALCGPTEERVTRIGEGFKSTTEDVRWLLKSANENLEAPVRAEDVVSLRCGIRPLAVRRDFSKIVHPLELSRRHLIHLDHSRNVIAVYGGKLTSCGDMAEQVLSFLSPHLKTREIRKPLDLGCPPAFEFPGIDEPMPSPLWCRDHESCHTLEDYLRRRTNISQWVPRCGLGLNSENRKALRQIARVFSPDALSADKTLRTYEESVRLNHDAILAAV